MKESNEYSRETDSMLVDNISEGNYSITKILKQL